MVQSQLKTENGLMVSMKGVDDSLTLGLAGKGIHFTASSFDDKFCFSREVTKAQKANSFLSANQITRGQD